jgi:(p)ppGpp synthase/HD superfamily hydrolase
MTPHAVAVHPLARRGRRGPQLGPRFLEAVELAVDLHGAQRRAGTAIPYLSHLLIVTGLLLEEGGDETCAIAAMLHEAVEECGGTALERIRDQFGAEVGAMVIECSDDAEAHDSASWKQRKRRHLEHMAGVDDPRLLLILLADKVHNARSIVRDLRVEGNALWTHFGDRTMDDQIWYFGELVDLFGARCAGPLVDDLRRSVAELRVLAVCD